MLGYGRLPTGHARVLTLGSIRYGGRLEFLLDEGAFVIRGAIPGLKDSPGTPSLPPSQRLHSSTIQCRRPMRVELRFCSWAPKAAQYRTARTAAAQRAASLH